MGEEKLQTLAFSAALSSRLEEASEILKAHKEPVKIVSHYDPDGICAAAIACQLVKRLGNHFQATLSKKLDESVLIHLRGSVPKNHIIIMTDMGSSKVSLLDEFPQKVIVIDHHQPEKDGQNVIHLNPHLFDIDGSREASAASFTFALAITIDKKNWDLASLALAGAIGDRQSLGGFMGFNEDLASAAEQREAIKAEKTINMKSQTIRESLLNHPEPYFVGITGREKETEHVLNWLGIEKQSALKDLDDEKRRFLASVCALRLMRQGATPEAVKELVTTRYWLFDWDMYADELSALLNACARQGEQTTGLVAALGDKRALEKALALRGNHEKWIIDNLMKLEEKRPKAMSGIQYFHTTENSYSGVLAGLGTLYFFDRTKATLGIAAKDGSSNVSARAPRKLVEQGVNLGLACKLAGEKCGGIGGGHNIAAGATVPTKSEKAFLKEMDRLVCEQLAKKE